MNNYSFKKDIAFFGSVKVLVFAALMCSLSGIFKFLAPTGDTWRISFENFPIIFSGILFGPFVGSAVGICADLLGCLIRGFSVNPLITLASMSVGLVSGIVFKLFGKNKIIGIGFTTFSAHIIGNIIIKTIVLSAVYGSPFLVLLIQRAGTYSVTALAESLIIILLYKNKVIKNALKRITGYEL